MWNLQKFKRKCLKIALKNYTQTFSEIFTEFQMFFSELVG